MSGHVRRHRGPHKSDSPRGVLPSTWSAGRLPGPQAGRFRHEPPDPSQPVSPVIWRAHLEQRRSASLLSSIGRTLSARAFSGGIRGVRSERENYRGDVKASNGFGCSGRRDCVWGIGFGGRSGESVGRHPVTGGATCPIFPTDNVWNTDVSGLPVDSHSAAWLASMDSAATSLHPDFGPSGDPSNPYGMPYTVVSPAHPLTNVSFQYASESDPGPYPFGADTPIEGGTQSSGNRHAIMVNPATCTLFELYDAQYNPAGSTAGSGAIWNLNSDVLRPSGWTSADAAGLPILPGLLRYDEVQSGSITHAIRLTAQSTDTSFIWPARHDAGTSSDPSLPPMGARFRLKASYDISGFSPQARVVLRAMQHYGLILADNGSNWYFGGTADQNWPIALVDELKTNPGRRVRGGRRVFTDDRPELRGGPAGPRNRALFDRPGLPLGGRRRRRLHLL